MRALCLSILLFSATLLTATPAPADEAGAPETRRALVAHALTAGACQPEGAEVRCALSAILVQGVPTPRSVARETPRLALYVSVAAVPTPAGVLILSAKGHQERWAPAAAGRLTARMVFLDLLDEAAAHGEILTFVHDSVVETSQAFTPSPEDIQATLELLRDLFLIPQQLL